MAVVDKTGIIPATLDEYKEILEERFLAEFGEELSLEPETPQGQMVGIMALALTEIDEQLVELAQAMSLHTAAGPQLEELGSILDIRRFLGSKSRVTATLRGTVGVTVPQGSIAATADGIQFTSVSSAVLAGDTGVEVIFEAVQIGAIEVAAGDLSQRVTEIPGWSYITNASPATVGQDQESDSAYRLRYGARTAHGSLGALDSLRAAIQEAGATYIKIEENFTDEPRRVKDFTINGHSVVIIVEGGTDSDITEAITSRKTLGAAAMTGIIGAGVSAPLTPTGTDFSYAGETFSGYTQPAADTLEAFSTALQAALETSVNNKISSAAVDIHNGSRFVVTYPWHDGFSPNFDTSELPEAMKLRPEDATASPGPFFRTDTSDLNVAMSITIDSKFPASGLETLRSRLIQLVKDYDIGETPWKNDFLVVAEQIPGVRVTSLTVQEGDTDIASVSPPLNRRWNLPTTSLNITVSR